MKTIWQGAPAVDRGGWFMGGGWAARAVAQEEEAEPGANPNLLLRTEEFENAVWAAAGVSVAADTVSDPLSGSTADRASFDPEGLLAQASTTAATTGLAVASIKSAGAAWQRFSVTGTFDGLPYTFSVYAKSAGGSVGFRMGVARVLLVLAAQLSNQDDVEGITVDFWGAQLEQAAAATAYQRREGT